MRDYVSDLRHLSGLELKQEEKVVLDDRLLDELVQVAQAIGKNKKVYLSVMKELPRKEIRIRKSDLLKIFQNIFQNAVHYTNGKKNIQLSFFNEPENYQIIIFNEGTGFSPEALKRATVKFYTEYKNRNGHHYGMGLNIVENLMKQNNGEVQLENIEEAGKVLGAKVILKFYPVKLV